MPVARRIAVALMAMATLAATACFPGAGGHSRDGVITVWTVLVLPNELEQMQSVLDDFTAGTGIETELVAIDPGDMPTAVTNAAAAGDLPDVLFHTVDLTQGWAADGILDAGAAEDVIASLGRETFNPAALDLVRSEGRTAAVPSDGWGQLIFYREDLFEEAGLEPPTDFDAIEEAARTLHGGDTVGLLAGTSTSTPYTQQTFEHIALANGCELVDSEGRVDFHTPRCVEAIDRYTTWMTEYSAGGQQDELSTRATYLSGRAAMMIWSPHLFDELYGLSTEIAPSCPECADDPGWLADNTGFVQRVSGPGGDPVQFGQTLNLGITPHGDVEEAQEFVGHLLSDGYPGLLEVAAEGQFPMRPGTGEAPEEFIGSWKEAEVGDTAETSTIGAMIGEDGVSAISDGALNFERWAVAGDQGPLVQALYGEFVVSQALQHVMQGTMTPDEAARQVQERAEELSAD